MGWWRWVALSSVALTMGCERPAVCGPEGGLDLGPASPLKGRAIAHAHNDYLHDHPLRDALSLGYRSVETDVWIHGSEVIVSHWGFASAGTLKDLYLDPLQARITARGSVHGDDEPFTLWIDVKSRRRSLQDALVTLLDAYPMLHAVGPDAPLRVVLTGEARAKAALVARLPPAASFRDSNDFAATDPSTDGRWVAYALRWNRYVSWDGEGEPSPAERGRLRCILHAAHDKGRRVRFFATPETPAFWRFARSEGFDFVNTDELAGLRAAWDDLDDPAEPPPLDPLPTDPPPPAQANR